MHENSKYAFSIIHLLLRTCTEIAAYIGITHNSRPNKHAGAGAHVSLITCVNILYAENMKHNFKSDESFGILEVHALKMYMSINIIAEFIYLECFVYLLDNFIVLDLSYLHTWDFPSYCCPGSRLDV